MRPRTRLILVALGLWLVGHLVPYGEVILYPFTLLTTWVHETGHGLTAIICGGSFIKLQIYGDASGVAFTTAATEARHAWVALGGLLAPPLLGAAVLALVHGPRSARVFLGGLAAAMLASAIIWVRSPVGLVSVPLTALALGALAWRASAAHPERKVLLVQAIGVMLAADTLTRMVSYVFMKQVTVNGVVSPSDIATVAHGFGGPQLVWGIIVTIIAVGLLALGLWRAWRAPAPPRTAHSAPLAG
jgi:hypothetical protein